MRLVSDFSSASAPFHPRLRWDAPYDAPDGTAAAAVLDFARGIFGIQGERISNPVQFTRASTGTSLARDGRIREVPANTPRYDLTPETGQPCGLRVEGESRNSLLHSADFGNHIWQKEGVEPQSSSHKAPGANAQMSTFVPNGTTARAHMLFQEVAASTNQTWCFSLYVRAHAGTGIRMGLAGKDAPAGVSADFNLTTGQATPSNAETVFARITPLHFQPGVWRISMSAVPEPDGASSELRASISLLDSTGNPVFLAGGQQGISLWGAQLEPEKRPSSYIPTSTNAKTRSADTAILPLGDWFKPNEGSIAVHFSPENVLENEWVWALNDGNLTDRLEFRMSWGNRAQYVMLNNGGPNEIVGFGDAQSEATPTGSAIAFSNNSLAAAFRGAVVKSQMSGTVPTGFTQLELGRLTSASRTLNGTISRLIYYPKRLPDGDLLALSA